MEKNKDIKLNASIENTLKVNPKVKELVSNDPELNSYLTELSDSLNDAVNSIGEACGVLDLLGKIMSNGNNYTDDMTSEADSIRVAFNVLTTSMEKISDTADLMQYTTFKEN